MGIRMSSLQFMSNYNRALNNSYQRQAKLYEQSDGSKLHRASDNPMDYAKYLRYNVNDSENTQYRANIKTASSWMKSSDDVMIHVTEIMQTLKEKSVDAANSRNVEDDYAAMYKEMFGGVQEMVSSLNTQWSDRYLFSGQKDLTKPFEISNGTYERGLAKTLDVSQAAFFKGTSSDYNMNLFQMLELERDGETFYLDTESGDIFTKDFVDKGYKEIIANGYTTLEEAKNSDSEIVQNLIERGISDTTDGFRVSDYFTNQGRFLDDNNREVDGYIFASMEQHIVTYNGDENLISMVKLNGATDPASDTVNSTGGRMFGRDIFDNEASGNEPSGTAMLNELLTVCEKTNNCEVLWMSSDGVTIADVAHATMVVEETRIGARQQLYTSVEAMLERQGDNITEDITNVSSTDISQLATKLMEMTTLYNLSLSIGGRILPQSLADYLS